MLFFKRVRQAFTDGTYWRITLGNALNVTLGERSEEVSSSSKSRGNFLIHRVVAT
jgi:hypothetical protein